VEAEFSLDPRLAASSIPLGRLGLCEVRLQDDRRWPWLVLVPIRPGLVELDDLPPRDRVTLVEEAVSAGAAVRSIGEALGAPVEKLNTGALGNVVPQLHVHLVGRRPGDPAWPGPVWGHGQPLPYAPETLERARAAVASVLPLL
jgi:diadenosine tetraphosphate (Ap4A) HIT family hydrolase